MTARARHLLQRFLLPLMLAVVVVILGLSGPAAQELLRYDRSAILAGEWWRLLSGHLVHLGGSHLAMNLGGLVLVWALVGERLSTPSWLVVLLVDALLTGLGLLAFNPLLCWYVGLSGVLHGLLVAGCVAEIRSGGRGAWLLLLMVWLKLIWEQAAGPLPGSEASAGGMVIVDAHLYGALGGVLLGGLLPPRAIHQPSATSPR